jgi:hypothetical protein
MSPLLCLPAELRNEIYAYVIQNGTYRFRDRVVVQSGWLHLEVYMEEPRPRWAGLLCTSRQINTETRLLPYSLNTFSVLTIQQLEVLVERCAGSARDVTSIRLELDISIDISTRHCDLAEAFSGLKRVDLHFENDGSPDLLCMLEPRYSCCGVTEYLSWENRKENIRQWLLHSSNSKFEVVLS